MTRPILAAVAALLVTACATVNTPVNKRQFESVQLGKSTAEEVRRNLGHPAEFMIWTDGRSQMMWQWSESQAKAESFIPFASTFGAGGVTGTTTKVIVRFDDRGIVSEIIRGGSEVDLSSAGIGTGYKSTGTQRGTAADLPDAPETSEMLYQRCDTDVDCKLGLTCSAPSGSWKRCMPSAPAAPAK